MEFNLVPIISGAGAVGCLLALIAIRRKSGGAAAAPKQPRRGRQAPVQPLRPAQPPAQPQSPAPQAARPQQPPQAQQQPHPPGFPPPPPQQPPPLPRTQVISMPTDAVLEVSAGPCAGQVFPLHPGDNYIGRAPRPDRGQVIALSADEAVSADHALIRSEGGQYILYDLASTNGTYRNQDRVAAPVALQVGDTIALGKSRLLFRREK